MDLTLLRSPGGDTPPSPLNKAQHNYARQQQHLQQQSSMLNSPANTSAGMGILKQSGAPSASRSKSIPGGAQGAKLALAAAAATASHSHNPSPKHVMNNATGESHFSFHSQQYNYNAYEASNSNQQQQQQYNANYYNPAAAQQMAQSEAQNMSRSRQTSSGFHAYSNADHYGGGGGGGGGGNMMMMGVISPPLALPLLAPTVTFTDTPLSLDGLALGLGSRPAELGRGMPENAPAPSLRGILGGTSGAVERPQRRPSMMSSLFASVVEDTVEDGHGDSNKSNYSLF
jgi:hypothetical protein